MAEKENNSHQVGGRKIAENVCKPCENKEKSTRAVVYCKNCEEYQCEECCKVHDIYAFMKGHVLVGVTQVHMPGLDLGGVKQRMAEKPKIDMKGFDTCTEHMEEFRFYCVDEHKLCCSHCMLKCHQQGCKNITSLSEEAEKQASCCTDTLSNLSQLEYQSDGLLQILQETQTSVGTELEPLLSQIEGIKQSVMKKIDDLKASVNETIEKEKLKVAKDLGEKLSGTRNVTEKLKTSKAFLTAVLENGSKEQRFIASFVVKNQVAKDKLDVDKTKDGIYRPIFSLKR